jgi:4-alpha-glucanotransferase
LAKIHLVLLIHSHQPVGNFDGVLEKVYQQSYLPFLEHLAKHPTIRMGLHYTGPLLEWFVERHPEFLEKLGELTARGQTELVGGGFYEPILISIPPKDQAAQIKLMSDFLSRRFGHAPAGAWLAERVWEPQLPSALAAAGVEYTLLDDVHFQSAGFELEQLHGYYIAEDRGEIVKVIPGLKSLRYLVPFRGVDEIIGFLRGAAEKHPGGMAAMGDDCEKFGAWPGTYDHCYRNGWLERFFVALEANRGWLVTTPPGEYLAEHEALGRADLPTASYTELMEWVLPTLARQQLNAIDREFVGRPDVLRFLRGGIWRGFLCKYPEVNLLHKKMLRVSKKVAAARGTGPGARAAIEKARTQVLRAQCNDAYWHGVFGGLYAPHLRTELWRELIRAETAVEALNTKSGASVRSEHCDFDADGAEEIYLTAKPFAALVKPGDGATVAALDFRPTAVALVNSLRRRAEAYHGKLAEAARGGGSGVASIHDQVRVKEPGLENRLRLDRWARHSFRLLLFPHGKTRADYDGVRLDESAAFAGGAYRTVKTSGGNFTFEADADLILPGSNSTAPRVMAVKEFEFVPAKDGFKIHCAIRLKNGPNSRGPVPQFQAGIEIVVNLLAPNEADRYFETGSASGAERHPLRWGGECAGPTLRAVDEWQNVAVNLNAPNVGRYWVAPIETVSESEEGFECVYQGSQILAVWPVRLEQGGEWSAELTMSVQKAHD